MTKEQVITRIKHSSMYKDDRETADYIIKALEQQPSDDCVSRKDLLAQINESWETIETKLDFVNIVKASPSEKPKVPTSDDCVSRQAVLKSLKSYVDDEFDAWVILTIFMVGVILGSILSTIAF